MRQSLSNGEMDTASFKATPAGLTPPRVGARIVLAVDVSPWLHPDAPTSPDRTFCHTTAAGRAKPR